MTRLRPPAHPDNFRVKVGRYGDRWYIDHLPGDGRWEPMEDPVPSVSAVKNAWPKFLSKWAANEAALCAVRDRDAWTKLDPEGAVDYIAKAPDRSRDASAARGNSIHAFIEATAEGQGILLTDLPDEYEAVCKLLVEELRPEFLLTEAVAIKRGPEGYGGTLDAIATLDGYGRFLIDWKSRKAGKGGTAYPDEFAQGAAYRAADYLIVSDDDHEAVRVDVPEVDGLAVITIEPEAYCVCVPDSDGKAVEAWTQLRRFWAVQTLDPPRSRRLARTDAKTKPAAAPAPAKPRLGNAVALPKPEPRPRPDEGGPADAAKVERLRADFNALDGTASALLARWVKEGTAASVPWNLGGNAHTLRRLALGRTALNLITNADLVDPSEPDDADEAVRLVLAQVLGDEALKPALTVGGLIGSLTIDEARQVNRLAKTARLSTGADGAVTLVAA